MPPDNWLSGRAARARLGGVSPYVLMKLAAAGQIRFVTPPGGHPRFHAEDVERIAAERDALLGEPGVPPKAI